MYVRSAQFVGLRFWSEIPDQQRGAHFLAMLLLLVLAVGLVHPSMALRNVMAYGNKCYESRPETVNFNTALANSATKVGPTHTHSRELARHYART